jgi:hypothetical protein
MVGAVSLRDEPRPVELVEGALFEPDREGADLVAAFGGGEGGERAGVDPAREEHPNRNVGDQMRADGVAEPAAELLGERLLIFGPELIGWGRRRSRVSADRHLSPLGDQEVPGRQLPRLLEDRQGCRDRIEGEERLERVGIDLAGETGLAEQRLQLRCKRERSIRDPVVEGLDPEAVSGEHDPALTRVPERDREHPPQILDERRSTLLIEVNQNLGVALGRERVAPRSQPVHQPAVVINLAVLDHADTTVLARDRLVAAGEIDDGEPPHCEPAGTIDHAPV